MSAQGLAKAAAALAGAAMLHSAAVAAGGGGVLSADGWTPWRAVAFPGVLAASVGYICAGAYLTARYALPVAARGLRAATSWGGR